MRQFITILILLIILTNITVFGQIHEAPSQIITTEFCKENDISRYLATWEETGTDGVFDTSYWRIQIHFEIITKDKLNPTIYHITGASRHKKVVTGFTGEIVISEVQQYDREFYWSMDTTFGSPPEDHNEKQSKYTYITAQYQLYEDSSSKYSGLFSGTLTFGLHQTLSGELLDDLLDYEGDGYSNFTYEGTWTSYKTHHSKLCYWGDGRLPIPSGIDNGACEFVIAEKYWNNGWQRNDKFELIDNPKFWWRR